MEKGKYVGVLTLGNGGAIRMEVLYFDTARDARRYLEAVADRDGYQIVRVVRGITEEWCRQALSFTAHRVRESFDLSFGSLPLDPDVVEEMKSKRKKRKK